MNPKANKEESEEDKSGSTKTYTAPIQSKSTGTSNVGTESKVISCLGVSVPCDEQPVDEECPILENVEKYKVQEYVSDKDVEALNAEQFAIRQSIKGFKADTHYWFVIRTNNDDPDRPEIEIRFLAPYASDVVDFFAEHYFIEDIGHSSCLPLEEYIKSYNEENPGKFVHYAGTFITDSSGKIIKWSNDSGHFAPSIDYAAAIAKALGIMDAMFIPWNPDMEDVQKETIFYQQYKSYTGAYTAHNVEGKTITDIDYEKIFYPHDYHTWYKYHGPKNIHNGENNVHHLTAPDHHSVNNHHGVGIEAFMVLCFMFVLIGLGVVSTVFYARKRGKGRFVKKVVIDAEEDEDV